MAQIRNQRNKTAHGVAARVVLQGILVMMSGAVFAEPTAGLLHANLPGEDAGLVAAVARVLGEAGYSVAELDAAALCDPARLTPDVVDVLVLPGAAALPAASAAAIEAYIENGGDILALNAPLWQTLLVNPRGAWVSRDDYERETAAVMPEHVLFDFTPGAIEGWQRSFFPADATALYETVEDGPVPGQRALHGRVANLQNWDNFGPMSLERGFPEGHTLTVFSAKGGPRTQALSVEWQEQDGSRWIAVVPLSTEWRRYTLAPEDFKFWESAPARRNDRFHPENAQRLAIGMAFTHTGTTSGEHEWWVGPFGTAAVTSEYAQVISTPSVPAMDLLAPGYKFFRSTGVARVETCEGQAIVSRAQFGVPAMIRSIQPRPGGGGFEKGRTWRYVPLIETATADGEWRGAPAALMVHSGGQFAGGQWVSFGVKDAAWYASPKVLATIGEVLRKMRDGVYIMDGGANFYTYFADQGIVYGVRAANVGRSARANLTARVILFDADTGAEVLNKEWTLDLEPGAEQIVSGTWQPASWPEAGFKVTAEIVEGETVLDHVAHEAHVWRPKEKKSFITVKDGEFMLDGKRWRAHGVNFMPSSGIGTEDGLYFEHWVGARSYDPEIIQRDLDHCKDLGLNAVSIFIHYESLGSQNLLDLLRRLDVMGLKANLSLRPGTPIDFEWPKMLDLIQYYRLWEHDAIFALDLAWEPLWMTQKDRRRWDTDWAAWVVERYGSVENAEKDWECPIPRDEGGVITNPPAIQVEKDGDWRRMVSAYRRFLDTVLYKYYSAARTQVRGVYPDHLVSFRMTETGDPTMQWGGVLAYDFPYLAAGVDILEPEGYGRIGDWERVKPGWFEFEYARWAAPHLPMMWAEAGVHAWDVAAGEATPDKLAYQGQYLRDFYRMMIASGSDGIFWWWYPGGFRTGENSDYGIVNCDGSDRPSSQAIRDNTAALIDGPSAKPVDYWIEIDRDRYANGVMGIYNAVKDEFWKAIEDGHTPGLRTAGAGTDSGNCPLVAVGNTPCNGSNPPKYLDGFFDKVEVCDTHGRWVNVTRGARMDGMDEMDRMDRVSVSPDRPVVARVAITNLGEAEWRNDGAGAVYVTATSGGRERTLMPHAVAHFGSVEIAEVILVREMPAEPTEVSLSLEADGRTAFGEKYRVGLVVK